MRQTILEAIDNLLPKHHPIPQIQLLYTMMRDYPERGGKMLRSQLLLLTARAFNAPETASLPLAMALELFQNWVLIHDDIEDESEERRGKPALHRSYGVPLALNAGDALHVYMWQAVHQAGVPGAFEVFAQTIHRTAEGQHIDLSWVEHNTWDLTEQDYLGMVEHKTAYYTVIAPVQLGMLSAGITPDARIVEAGLALGAAFQIRDDVLNFIAEGTAYGKEIAGDLLEGKRTLVVLDWLKHAPREQKEFFLQMMQLKREQKNLEDIQTILSLLKNSSSIAYAQRIAEEKAKVGLALMAEILKTAPEQDVAQDIMTMLEHLLTRDH